MKKKILLVEDEAIIAMTTSKILEKHDFEVVTVHNGEKAIASVNEDPSLSLILMDIDLGKSIDGTEAAQEILKNHDIPIIFHTSHSEKEYVELVKKITRYGYVLKNSGEFVLIEAITMASELFEQKQQVREHQKERENANEKLLNTNIALQKRNEELRNIEKLLSNKIDLIFNPGTRLETIELKDLIQTEDIQAILNNFHELTGMVTALLDLNGNILVATGWKDICTKFHRIHPHTVKNCTESDLYLSDNLKRGEFIDYKCKNGLWDVISPLIIGNKHIGNIYTGQFFYSSDEKDESYFSRQAEKNGFDNNDYLKALRKVPVYNKETVHFLMNYLIGFFELVSTQSYTNIALARETLEHKFSRRELQKGKDNLLITLNSIGDAVISTDLNGNVMRMNPIAEKLTGWSIEIAKGKRLNDIFHIIHAGTREVVDNPVEKVLQSGTIVGLANHTALLSNDGHEYQIADSAAPIKDDEGNISGVVLVFRDVTEEYEKDRQIERNASLLEETQRLAHIGSWELDLTTFQLSWSDEIYRIFGLEPQEFGATYNAFLEAVHPEDRGKVDEAYTDSIQQSKDGYEIDHRIIRKKNGEIRFVHEKCIHVKDENGTILRSVGMVQDITKQKEAEDGLKNSRNKYKRLVNNSPNLLMETDVDTHEIISCNPAMAKNLGSPITSIVGKKIEDFIPADILQKRVEVSERAVETGESLVLEDQRGGKCFYTTYIPIISEAHRTVHTITSDVTERKQTENLLKEYANRLDLTIEAANMAWWEMDVESGKVSFNNKKAEMLGYKPDRFRHYEDFTKLVHIDDYEPMMTSMRALLDGTKDKYDIEYRIQSESGAYRWFYDIGTITHKSDEGKPVKVSGIVLDITDRKLTEFELRRNEKDLRGSQRIAHIGSWRLDVASNQVTWTEELYHMYGFDPLVPPPPYTEHMKLFTPESWEKLSTALELTRQTGNPYMLELETVRKDRSNGWMWVQGEADLDSAGKTIEIWGAAQDITERKQAEMKLAESEALLDATSFMAHVGGWQLDVNTMTITWTKETYRIYEVSLDYKPSLDMAIQFFHPDDRDALSQAIQQAIEKGKPYDMELRLITAKGNSRWTRAICHPETLNGKSDRLSGTFQDITERKRLEIDLKTKTEFLKNVTENMFDLVSLTNLEGNFIFVGKSHKILGYETDNLIGSNVMDLVHPEDYPRVEKEFKILLSAKENKKAEYRYKCSDGSYLWFETLGKILTDEEGKPEQILFSTRDITERKQADEKIRKQLSEKNFLMKELNHRVKNNLAMVSSLISLKDSETDEDLSDLKHRINVIKLVHEKLYQQNDVEHIEIKEYFQELLEAILFSTTNLKISIVNKCEEISITTQMAIHLGFVVNEIFTNAIKYGYTFDEKPIFIIEMIQDTWNDQYLLILSNTGNSFPEDINIDNPTTLGLRLITALVTQLDGTIELQKKPYPVFTISFPMGGE